jgi:hypothetical protein
MTTQRPPAPPSPPAPFTLRWYIALPIALPLIVLDTFWVILAEKVGQGPYFTTISLFANVVTILTALLIVNAGLRRFLPRWSLSQAEVMLIYGMVGIGAALAGHDMLPILVQLLGHPFHDGNAANNWLSRFGQYLPMSLMVSDKDVLAGYYQGHANFYQPSILRAWLRPVALWTVFITLLFGTMQCINVLMRQGWQDREKLPFPVVEIPLQMTDPDAALWRSRAFWAGFALVGSIEILNGISYLYPSVPSINLKHVDISGQGIFGQHPWNAVGATYYSFYPFVIGIAYLLPLDLLFSSWFFYFFWKAQLVLSAAEAWDTVPNFPFVTQQAFGGFFAILAFMFWNGRHYFKQVWERIWNAPSDVSDKGEGVSYRTAFIGTVAGFAGLVGFMTWAGMSPYLAAACFLIYFAISLTVTRIRAELGPPMHDLHFSGPDLILTTSLGTPAFSGRDLTMLTFFWSLDRAYRSHPQPIGLENLKAAKQIGASQRTTFWCILLAGAVGTVSVFWAYLHLAYAYGTEAKFHYGVVFANEAYGRLNSWLQTPTPPEPRATIAIGVGFLFCTLLLLARLRFPWWPFHPIGYAVSSSYVINLIWLPLLIAWIVKGLILRYGGVKLYRAAMPFFLGLTIGQMIIGSLWHLLGLAMDITPYSFWGG